MRIIISVAMTLGLILPANAQSVVRVDSLKVKKCSGKWYPVDPDKKAQLDAICEALKGRPKRSGEFPVTSPTFPETPPQRERYTKSTDTEKQAEEEKKRKQKELNDRIDANNAVKAAIFRKGGVP